MATCTSCARGLTAGALRCGACGALQPIDVTASTAKRPDFRGTLLGLPSVASASTSTAATVPVPTEAAPTLPAPTVAVPAPQTQIGSPIVTAPGPEPGPRGGRAFSSTVIGLPSVTTSPGQRAAAPAPPGSTPLSPPGSPTPSLPADSAMAPTEPSPRGVDLVSTARQSPAALVPAQAAAALTSATSDRPSFQSTLLGVAAPGIAPTASRAPAPPGPAGQALPAAQVAAPAPALQASPRSSYPPAGLQRRAPFKLKPVWVLAAVLGAGLAGAGAAVLLKKHPHLAVTAFEISSGGTDRLLVRCDDCTEVTSLRLGSSIVALKEGQARLEPAARLGVGLNRLQIELLGNDKQVLRVVTLQVPVAFRVETLLDGRHADPPHAEVVVGAPVDARVLIDGKPVKLVDGRASLALGLDEARGETAKIVAVSREVSVSVIAGGTTKQTVARVQTTIVPLEIATPAHGHVLTAGPLTVSGRTLPNARVRVGNQEAIADRAGEFSLVWAKPVPGLLRIFAETEALVTRTAELELVATPTASNAPLNPSTWTPGAPAHLQGRVVESRVVGGRTTSLVELDAGCAAPPCPVRVLYAQKAFLRPGQPLDAVGQIVFTQPPTLRATQLK